MRVHSVNLNLQLPADQLVDLFLFQWHTPEPIGGGTFHKIANPYVTQKRAVLEQFRDQFLARANPRLAFVILPEMSVPLSCVDVLMDVVNRVTSPLVIIGGIEPLPWAEYLGLAGSMGDTPVIEAPGNGNPASLWMNTAAVWVKADTGRILKFTQPKLHPSDLELPQFHRGENLIVFQSADQSALRRLNFCVQICSDFCSRRFVLNLRATMGEVCPGLHLDFLFLPQHNPYQEKAQFQESIDAFFDRTQPGLQTNEASLVFVNNASPIRGKAKAYGGSRIHFPYGTWRQPDTPTPTYWINDYTTYQASVVRESGPGLYHFTYKPHCYAGRRPGSGEVVPFTRRSFHAIDQDRLEDRAVDLFAEAHWLRNEWVAGTSEFVTDITESSTHGTLVAAKAES